MAPGLDRLREELLAAEQRLHTGRRNRRRRLAALSAVCVSAAGAGLAGASGALELVTADGHHHALRPGEVFAMEPGDTLRIGAWAGLLGCAPARVKVDAAGRSVTARGRSIVFVSTAQRHAAPASPAGDALRSLVEP